MKLSSYMLRGLAWSLFGFFYIRGLEMVLTMALDTKAGSSSAVILLCAFGFNLLVGHLISKYERLFPHLCAAWVALSAAFFVMTVSPVMGQIDWAMTAMILSSLILLTRGVIYLKSKLPPVKH